MKLVHARAMTRVNRHQARVLLTCNHIVVANNNAAAIFARGGSYDCSQCEIQTNKATSQRKGKKTMTAKDQIKDIKKQITATQKEIDRVWRQACKHDGIKTSANHAIFSFTNPHRDELSTLSLKRGDLKKQLRVLTA